MCMSYECVSEQHSLMPLCPLIQPPFSPPISHIHSLSHTPPLPQPHTLPLPSPHPLPHLLQIGLIGVDTHINPLPPLSHTHTLPCPPLPSLSLSHTPSRQPPLPSHHLPLISHLLQIGLLARVEHVAVHLRRHDGHLGKGINGWMTKWMNEGMMKGRKEKGGMDD
jgi:hypothetical protein